MCFGILGFSAESCLTSFVGHTLVKCDEAIGSLPDKLEYALDTALENIGPTAAATAVVFSGERIMSLNNCPQKRTKNNIFVVLDPA